MQFFTTIAVLVACAAAAADVVSEFKCAGSCCKDVTECKDIKTVDAWLKCVKVLPEACAATATLTADIANKANVCVKESVLGVKTVALDKSVKITSAKLTLDKIVFNEFNTCDFTQDVAVVPTDDKCAMKVTDPKSVTITDTFKDIVLVVQPTADNLEIVITATSKSKINGVEVEAPCTFKTPVADGTSKIVYALTAAGPPAADGASGMLVFGVASIVSVFASLF